MQNPNYIIYIRVLPEDRKTGGDDGEVPTSDQGSKMDKPQIWVRIRQGAIDNGLYEIGEDRKV